MRLHAHCVHCTRCRIRIRRFYKITIRCNITTIKWNIRSWTPLNMPLYHSYDCVALHTHSFNRLAMSVCGVTNCRRACKITKIKLLQFETSKLNNETKYVNFINNLQTNKFAKKQLCMGKTGNECFIYVTHRNNRYTPFSCHKYKYFKTINACRHLLCMAVRVNVDSKCTSIFSKLFTIVGASNGRHNSFTMSPFLVVLLRLNWAEKKNSKQENRELSLCADSAEQRERFDTYDMRWGAQRWRQQSRWW